MEEEESRAEQGDLTDDELAVFDFVPSRARNSLENKRRRGKEGRTGLASQAARVSRGGRLADEARDMRRRP
jgi:hypothetical protein